MSSGLRGVVVKAERARLQMRQNQWKRSPLEEEARHLTRDQRWRSAVEEEVPRTDRQKDQVDGRWERSDPPPPPPPPLERSAAEHPSPKRAERPGQGEAEQVAEEEEATRLVVCGAQRASLGEEHSGKGLPPHSVYMGGNPGLPWKSERLGKPVQS